MKIKLWTLLFILIFCTQNSRAQEVEEQKNEDYILLLNSISFSYEWSRGFLHELQREFGDHIDIRTEELFVPSISTMEQVEALNKSLLIKYPHPPKATIYIGDPGWIVTKQLYDKEWKDVPILISYSRSLMPRNVQTLISKDRGTKDLIPKEEVVRGYNIATFEQPFFIKETVDMILKLLPDMKKIAFIYDDRYISRVLQKELTDVVNENYPYLTVDCLSPQFISTESLLDTVSTYCRSVGIIYYSWFTPQNEAGSKYLNDNIQKVLYGFVKSPIFTLSDQNPASGNFAGGYYISLQNSNKEMFPVLSMMLDGKRINKTYHLGTGHATKYLDYNHLLRYNISPELYPKDAFYYNAPPTFFEEHRVLIIGSIIILILLISSGFLWLRLYMHRQTQTARNRKLLQSVLDNLPIAAKVVDVDKGMSYVYVNQQAEILFGLNVDEIIGKKDMASNNYKELVEKYDPKKNNSMTSEIKKMNLKDEQEHSLLVTRHVAMSPENHRWMISSALDITEMENSREQLEALHEKYKLVLQCARMIIMHWDIKKDLIYCNTEFNDDMLFQIHQKTVFESQEFFQSVHPEDVQELQDKFNELFSGSITIFDHEYRYINPTKEGEYIWVKGYAIVGKRDAQGKPLHIVGATTNISERREMQQALLDAKERAEESNSLKSSFLANMSHEIRTPLNAIVGFSSILAQEEDEYERQEYIRIIELNNALLLQLINDILDLSKIESNTFDFVFSEVNINELLHQVEQSARMRLKNDKVALILDQSLPQFTVHLESTRVMQIVNNFVINAIKFTRDGRIDIGYKIEDNKICIYVSDTGCGIATEDFQRIFERFVKIDYFEQGTGLGLPICKMLAEKLCYEISVDSQLGTGSTFWLKIPLPP